MVVNGLKPCYRRRAFISLGHLLRLILAHRNALDVPIVSVKCQLEVK
jgi:hypothetical protein